MRSILFVALLASCAQILGLHDYATDSGSDSDSGSASSGWGVTAIAAGYHQTCAIAGGSAYCWGRTPGTSDVTLVKPGAAVDLPTVTAIATSSATDDADETLGVACAISADRVYCWGASEHGELGILGSGAAMPHFIDNTIGAHAVAAGGDHACAIVVDELACWGADGSGQLGDEAASSANCPDGPCSTSAVAATGGAVTAISAGRSHTCATTPSSGVVCWGAGSDFELGNDHPTSEATPEAITVELTVSHVAAGSRHTCATDDDGSAWCWGANEAGQAGQTGMSTVGAATELAGIGGISAIAAGDADTCAIVGAPSGQVFCWGTNAAGQLGAAGSAPPARHRRARRRGPTSYDGDGDQRRLLARVRAARRWQRHVLGHEHERRARQWLAVRRRRLHLRARDRQSAVNSARSMNERQRGARARSLSIAVGTSCTARPYAHCIAAP